MGRHRSHPPSVIAQVTDPQLGPKKCGRAAISQSSTQILVIELFGKGVGAAVTSFESILSQDRTPQRKGKVARSHTFFSEINVNVSTP